MEKYKRGQNKGHIPHMCTLKRMQKKQSWQRHQSVKIDELWGDVIGQFFLISSPLQFIIMSGSATAQANPSKCSRQSNDSDFDASSSAKKLGTVLQAMPEVH